jgi:hypothetical protein
MAEQGNKSSKQSGKQGKIRAQSQEKYCFPHRVFILHSYKDATVQ